jgi:hypothetical protein
MISSLFSSSSSSSFYLPHNKKETYTITRILIGRGDLEKTSRRIAEATSVVNTE